MNVFVISSSCSSSWLSLSSSSSSSFRRSSSSSSSSWESNSGSCLGKCFSILRLTANSRRLSGKISRYADETEMTWIMPRDDLRNTRYLWFARNPLLVTELSSLELMIHADIAPAGGDAASAWLQPNGIHRAILIVHAGRKQTR